MRVDDVATQHAQPALLVKRQIVRIIIIRAAGVSAVSQGEVTDSSSDLNLKIRSSTVLIVQSMGCSLPDRVYGLKSSKNPWINWIFSYFLYFLDFLGFFSDFLDFSDFLGVRGFYE